MSRDYRFSGERRTRNFRGFSDVSHSIGAKGLERRSLAGRGLGITPLFIGPIMIPTSGSPLLRAMASIFDARNRASVDVQMWGLDQHWVPPHTGVVFRDMRLCVRESNVGGGITVQPWSEMPTQSSCRNVDGRVFGPNCRWGYWELTPCNMDTATQYMFQYQRYLWAQSRLRDMLATKPVKGVTDPMVAADWVWLATQYISVLLWSTNVRFDYSDTGVFGREYQNEYERNGLFLPDEVPDLPAYVVYGDINPRILNRVNGDQARLAPTSQEWFSPDDTWHMRQETVDPSYLGIVLSDGSIQPYNSTVPIGLTAEQRNDMRREATEIIARGGGTWESYRWAGARAFLNWTFRATWNWDRPWRTLSAPVVYQSRRGWGSRLTMSIGGADVLLAKIVRQVEHYARRELLYTSWMQSAVTAYDISMSSIPMDNQVRVDWIRSRSSLTSSLARAATQEQNVMASSSGLAVLSAALGIVSLLGGAAVAFAYVMQGAAQIATTLFSAFGVTINERHPCPPLPFLRVTTGTCDLDEGSITSALLGVDSAATWPLAPTQISSAIIVFKIDGTQIRVDFQATDTTADAVARRINSAAAALLPPTHPPVSSVRRSQVHVEGQDPAEGPVQVIGGNAYALQFPGLTPPATRPPRAAPTTDPAGDTLNRSGGGGGFVALVLTTLAIGGGVYYVQKRKQIGSGP